ncbi:serine protease Do [Aliiroseovarius sediminilitoris]|uniref:Probable periplasmic serine endoprotease DegP-like n=1 Tax=Aliiroseovarius sediminilitoris TaxID=1173584 RepID=A0A1I0QG23_9RHOB|nr:trypsin-like peptidase domain-containing protein [Aliiroseovarius sediminilitoris]SEW25795.1 serine protease Do [Aliiroseovarius sediminilitoris]
MTHPRSPKRRTRLTAALLAATIASTGLVSLAPSTALAVPAGGYADLIEQFSPAVVLVEVTQTATPAAADGGMPNEEFFKEFQRRFGDNMPQMPQIPNMPDRQGVGSGFIISSDGLIVTNNHVIDGATSVTVKFADGSEHVATVVGTDPLTDIALLDIEGSDLPTVSFGSSKTMRVGDEVIAMGNPFGLGGTVTTGIVSAKDRNINAGPFDEFIQTDAAINRGNSGGPLFNDRGEVIGVNTAIFSPNGASAGVGFAVPSDLVSKIVADLQDDGQIDRGWLGVQIKPVSEEVASALGLQAGQGTMIEKVMDGTPAQRAGLQSGDIILSFDGAQIDEARDLTRAVAGTAPDTLSKVQVLRKGERLTLDVTLANRATAQDA